MEISIEEYAEQMEMAYKMGFDAAFEMINAGKKHMDSKDLKGIFMAKIYEKTNKEA